MPALETLERLVAAIRGAAESREYEQAIRLCGEVDDATIELARSLERLRVQKARARAEAEALETGPASALSDGYPGGFASDGLVEAYLTADERARRR